MTTCATCHHHEPDGTCTRFPPQYAGRDEGEPIYTQPVTASSWRCGEHLTRMPNALDVIRVMPEPMLRMLEFWAQIAADAAALVER